MNSHTSLNLLLAAGTCLGLGACSGDATDPEGTGTLNVIITTAGVSPDPDGYEIRVGSLPLVRAAPSDSLRVADVPAGSVDVVVSGVEPNCAVAGGLTHDVEIAEGQTARLALAVECQPTTGSIRIEATLTGVDLDPDGYQVELDGEAVGTFTSSETIVLDGLEPGEHAFSIAGLSGNCRVREQELIPLHVIAGQVVFRPVRIRCGLLLYGGGRLRTVSLDGVDIVTIAESRNDEVFFEPTWSPDGSRIVYQNLIGTGLHLIGADGTNRVRLTSGEFDYEAAWSPDGSKIAFVRSGLLWLMNADGSDAHEIPGGSLVNDHPTWSPDGEFIAYSCSLPNGRGLCSMRNDGTERQVIYGDQATGQIAAMYPTWSPDGAYIAFSVVEGNSGRFRLAKIRPDGTDLIPLTTEEGDFLDTRARWSLGSDVLAFVRTTNTGTGYVDVSHWIPAEGGHLPTPIPLVQVYNIPGGFMPR
jgi:hypothetical protein